ncbi:hypothetical protein Tco_0281073 [Tanacetum coccineum]
MAGVTYIRPLPCPMIHLSEEFTYLEVMRAECNLKGIDGTCTKLSGLVKTGISKVSTTGHYLVLLCITSCCYALLSTAGHNLVLLGASVYVTVHKVVARSSKRIAEEELGKESLKRQKIGEGSEPANESKDKESDENSQNNYNNSENTGKSSVWEHFWDLVRERFSSTEPTDDKERALWVELKRLFEPDTDDLLELQRYMHDPLTWRLYDTCGVHHVSIETG